MFEIRDLKRMLALSEHRSLRQAADAIRVGRSGLSRRRSSLEDRLGASPCERDNGVVRRPTVAGLQLLAADRRILDDSDALYRKLKSHNARRHGRLAVRIQASPATGNMRSTLIDHLHRLPDVDVRIDDGDREHLLSVPTTETVDVAVITRSPQAWDDRILSLWSERAIAALPASHPLVVHGSVRWLDLAVETVQLPEHGSGPEIEQLIVARLDGSKPQRIVMQDGWLDRVSSIVNAGHGNSLVPEGGAGLRFHDIVFREVQDGDLQPSRLSFAACWSRANKNASLASFRKIFRERYLELSRPERSERMRYTFRKPVVRRQVEIIPVIILWIMPKRNAGDVSAAPHDGL